MTTSKVFTYLYHLFLLPVILRQQWLPPERIIACQQDKLKKIIHHAYAKVPYYRNLFDSRGIDPEQITTIDDLGRLPILTKELIVKNYPDSILAAGTNRAKSSIRKTSGSSGRVLEIVLDLSVTYQYHLQQFRQLLDIGYRPTDKITYIRYSPPTTRSFLQKIGLFRRDTVQLTLSPAEQVQQIIALKPDIINAYPSVLYLLARNISSQDADRLNLKCILSNSEKLYPHLRQAIENTFHCKVYDDYSCLECSSIGFECSHQNLHVTSDNVIVEIVDDNDAPVPVGVEGRIIITALNNFFMPFIRYEIGDVGALSPTACPCGRGFPIFKEMTGRRDDFLIMPDGSLLDPQSAVFQVETTPGILEFQIIQQQKDELIINVVIEQDVDRQQTMQQIQDNLQRLVPEQVSIVVEVLEQLDRTATGKLRSVKSTCRQEN